MNLKPKVMKTQVSNKIGLNKFESLSEFEMANVVGGKNDKKDFKAKNVKTPREKDVFDPDEH